MEQPVGASRRPGLALNFGRVNDPIVDENLATARSDPDPAKRQAAAEEVNRQMAKECYQIPYSYTLWGTMHTPAIHGLGESMLPDGTRRPRRSRLRRAGSRPAPLWVDQG